jgi:hypothetical protein
MAWPIGGLVLVLALLCLGPGSASALTYGVGYNALERSEVVNVKNSGATVMRVDFDMSLGSPGNNWGAYDGIFEEASLRGITLLPILVRTNEAGERRFLLTSGSAWENWKTWVKEAVKRYGKSGSFWTSHPGLAQRPPIAWEVGNEPNLAMNDPMHGSAEQTKTWCENHNRPYSKGAQSCVQPEQYGEFLKGTTNVIRGVAAESNGVVLFAGLYMPEGYYYNSFIEDATSSVSELTSKFNGVSIHPYVQQGLHRVEDFEHEVEDIRFALDNHVAGGAGKSLWLTEIGWPVRNEEMAREEGEEISSAVMPVSEAEQANLLTASFQWIKNHATANNIQLVAWYNMRDRAGTHWSTACGLQGLGGTYRPSWYAFQDATGTPRSPAPPPLVGTTTEATNVGTFQATGNGIVETKGLPTTYYFQWGTTTSYGNTTGAQDAGSSWNATAVNAGIGFLTSGTTYHYRLVATNSNNTSYGPDKTFTSSPNGAFFSDASNGNNMSRWEWNTSKGWQQEFLYGHTIAAGTSPATLMINGQPNVFYVDASNGNTITDWTWNSTTGWQQQPFWGHTVAKGTSPVATTVNGEPSVFYVDASNGNTISEWKWNSTTGWQQLPFWGHQVAAGSSPSAVYVNGVAHVFYVDATYGNTITDWTWTPTAGWQQTFFYGDTVAAGTSPAALNIENTARAFYVDASRGNTVTEWSSPGGWHQLFLGGHSVVSGSSPSGIVSAGTPYVFFGDANNSKSLSAWTWNATEGWHQYFLYGHALTEGTSPAATLVNGVPNVFFNDASDANTITDWIWNSTTGWQQSFFWGHPLSAGSSPGVF